MQFTRLRLHGFKSFVESTDLHIAPGLTGVVGPNGCGKSNLVEALRWVMGENSAKRLRGSGMDDVIFGGTVARPARNLAEVSLHIDNPERSSASDWHNDSELEVVRKIERDSGSDYRINGKPVRQRDVQTLFADLATGAHSTSMVSQGRIGALIQAKPQERRAVLEEAAGLSGLHARRHEAELKLRAAEQNLTRVEDVIANMEQQLRALKQQARQAARYRSLSDRIRKAEAALFSVKWAQAEATRTQAEQEQQQADRQVEACASATASAEIARLQAAEKLPPLREATAQASAVLQRLHLERENVQAEQDRLQTEIASLEHRLADNARDLERESALRVDAQESLQQLEFRISELREKQGASREALPAHQQAAQTQRETVAHLESEAAHVTRQIAAGEETRRNLLQRQADQQSREQQLRARLAELQAEQAQCHEEIAARPDLTLAASMVEACAADLAKKQEAAGVAEAARTASEIQVQERRQARDAAQTALTGIAAEITALENILRSEDSAGQPALDSLSVPAGLETALAAVMGDALTAGLCEADARYWQMSVVAVDAQALPAGAVSLSSLISGAPALHACLSHIGLVDDEADVLRLSAQLRPGQALVSRSGFAARWDGYVVTPRAVSPEAVRLQQRNRLTELHSQKRLQQEECDTAQRMFFEAQALFEIDSAQDQAARQALAAAFAALNDARAHHSRLTEQNAEIASRLKALDEMILSQTGDVRILEITQANLAAEIAALPDLEHLHVCQGEMAQTLSSARQDLAALQAAYEGARMEGARVEQLAQDAERESAVWRNRLETAQVRSGDLESRQETLRAALNTVRQKPEQLAERCTRLLSEISVAESERAAAADAQTLAESALQDCEKALKLAETAFAEARETRVRAEGRNEQAVQSLTQLRERIEEKLGTDETGLAAIAEFDGGEIPALEKCEADVARLYRERDQMGAVNLRAEEEANTLQASFDTITSERDDLINAIAKLRQGIGSINKEARERLQAAFTEVDRHFQELFTRVFGGGRAHLQLTEGEDPLECGLEIFACPPGKKLQILSLLSGGEQALTAVALLFALFLTNPSPICVLDEVDAPLDEANVGRFCDMLHEIAAAGKTRFLVITHNRMTMARMDRLYGVTMQEKGVSTLVSVDLRKAEEMVEPGGITGTEAALSTVAA